MHRRLSTILRKEEAPIVMVEITIRNSTGQMSHYGPTQQSEFDAREVEDLLAALKSTPYSTAASSWSRRVGRPRVGPRIVTEDGGSRRGCK
jgi:hypothetical protein